MQNEQSGGCLCGEVRYTFKADPALSFSCHCRDCQRATGSVCASAFAVPKSSLQLSGNTNTSTNSVTTVAKLAADFVRTAAHA